MAKKTIKIDIKAEELKQKLNIRDGKDGKNYILTNLDRKRIAREIEVPVVEKIVEKTEVIREQPIVTEVAVTDNGEQIITKINEDETSLIKKEKIEGLDETFKTNTEDLLNRAVSIVDNRTSFLINKVSKLSEEVANINPVETQDLQAVTDLGSTTTNSITAQSFITTGGTSADVVLGDGTLDSKVKIIEVEVTTARTTATKIGTTASGTYTPVYGDRINVTFTFGCAVNTPTLNIDGSGAKNIRLGTASVSTALLSTAAASVTVPLWYDGTYWQMYGSQLNTNTTYSEITEAEIDAGTAGTLRTITGRRAKYMLNKSVPYTGATADVDLGNRGITAKNGIFGETGYNVLIGYDNIGTEKGMLDPNDNSVISTVYENANKIYGYGGGQPESPNLAVVDGNVGIGTPSPNARLHISNGDVYAQNLAAGCEGYLCNWLGIGVVGTIAGTTGYAAGYFEDAGYHVFLADNYFAVNAYGPIYSYLPGYGTEGAFNYFISGGGYPIGVYGNAAYGGDIAGYFTTYADNRAELGYNDGYTQFAGHFVGGSDEVYLADGTYAINATGNTLLTGALEVTGTTTLDTSLAGVLYATAGVVSSETPVADGTYTMGLGATTDGTITITNGVITAVQECT